MTWEKSRRIFCASGFIPARAFQCAEPRVLQQSEAVSRHEKFTGHDGQRTRLSTNFSSGFLIRQESDTQDGVYASGSEFIFAALRICNLFLFYSPIFLTVPIFISICTARKGAL